MKQHNGSSNNSSSVPGTADGPVDEAAFRRSLLALSKAVVAATTQRAADPPESPSRVGKAKPIPDSKNAP